MSTDQFPFTGTERKLQLRTVQSARKRKSWEILGRRTKTLRLPIQQSRGLFRGKTIKIYLFPIKRSNLVKVQTARLQDDISGRKATEKSTHQSQPETLRRLRSKRTSRKSHQDVLERAGPQLPLPRLVGG